MTTDEAFYISEEEITKVFQELGKAFANFFIIYNALAEKISNCHRYRKYSHLAKYSKRKRIRNKYLKRLGSKLWYTH